MALEELPPSAQGMYKTWWSTVMAWAAETNPATGSHYSASDISVLASASRELYPSVYPSYSPPGVSALYTRALAIVNSPSVLASADPAGPIPEAAVAVAPWSQAAEVRAAQPVWQARIAATYTTAEGITENGIWTVKIDTVLPSSVASLFGQTEFRVADFLAAPPGTGTPRKGELQSIDSITLLAVLGELARSVVMASDSVTSREKYLARQARYNSSLKGRQRYQRYEAKHPERATAWSVIMQVKAYAKPPF